MQAGFGYQEGLQEGMTAGYLPGDGNWNGGKPPPRIEPRLTLAARALRLRPPPPGEAGRRRRRAARACGPRPACGPPAWSSPRCRLTPARARGVLAWRRRET
jgi:hypothetical protein